MSPQTTNRNLLAAACASLLALLGASACQESQPSPSTDPASSVTTVDDKEDIGQVSSRDTKNCTKDSDCGGGNNKCDLSSSPGRCVERKEIGEACGNDQECNGGITGTARVCINSKCADACKQDSDCPGTQDCKKTGRAPTGKCTPNACTFDYPSVSIIGITTPQSVKTTYANRGCGAPPGCMIDTNNIIDAKTRQKLSYKSVQLGPHFSLYEMSHQSQAKSPYVYVDPDLIKSLEATRNAYGTGMTINSGFRSAVHQEAVCRSVCPGRASYCRNKCAKCSDHMGGQAADLKHSSPKCKLGKPSCTAGKFHLIYNEPYGGDHLHIDLGSGNRVCTYKGKNFQCGK